MRWGNNSRHTLENEEHKESKVVASLRGVADVVEEAEVIVGTWDN